MSLPALIDKRELRGKTKLRSPSHRDWIREHFCSVPGCRRMPIECAHVSFAWSRGVGMKSNDGMTIALCKTHHGEQTRTAQRPFEKKYGINMEALAKEFYRRSPYRHRLSDPWEGRP